MKYKVTINDELFGELTGKFEAKTKKEAVVKAKEFYSVELDTTPEYIEIVNILPE